MHTRFRDRTVAGLVLAILLACTLPAGAQEKPPYLDTTAPLDKRIDDLLGRLTLEEKVAFCHAASIFGIAPVPRLTVPALQMDDGPMGVREETGEGFRVLNRTDDFATAMPAPIALAAAWDTRLAKDVGRVIGEEARNRGKHVMLAPAINIMRTPLCGRNFEYYGEDPLLAGLLAVDYINGMQAQNVAACVKHFAVNNQETLRGSINVELDERTLREIYLPAFKAAVQQGGALSIMAAYNRVRGSFCAENDFLLNKVLRNEWGFKGFVVSDWGGVHTTDGAATSGLDIEMGSGNDYSRYRLSNAFLDGLKSGKYPVSAVDAKVRNVLYVMFKLNLIGTAPSTNPAERGGSLNTPEHHLISQRVAEEGMVLLKNEQALLPLDLTKIKTVAVIGENAVQKFAKQGFGATVKASYEVTPLEGITKYVGDRAKITTAAGYVPPGRSGRGRGRGAATAPATAPDLIGPAIAAAQSADVVIFVGGLNHTAGYDDEGTDRRDMKLPPGQDALIARLIEANPKTIVVLNTGGPLELPWLANAPSVLVSWYGGMESGTALARVLFGDVSPSGKLPFTFPKALSDSPAHALNAFPGANGVVKYEEGLLVGYRWFDTKGIAPLFPFGHGLSYTKFEYSKLKVIPHATGVPALMTAEFDIANMGTRAGAEAVQLYVQDVQSSLPRPAKELKAFAKVMLKPGEKQTVRLALDAAAFSYFDPEKHGWVAERGEFKILVGASSADIRLNGAYMLAETIVNDKP